MATTKTIQPTNTTITMPGYTDNADVAVLSTNLSNITDAVNLLNSNITAKEWNPANGDSLLTWLLANIPDRTKLPFSFIKKGTTATVADAPFNANQEFSGVVEGYGDRLNVTLKSYNGKRGFYRSIWQNTWLGGWNSIDIADESTFTLDDGESTVITTVANRVGLLIFKAQGTNLEYCVIKGYAYINRYAKGVSTSNIYEYNYNNAANFSIVADDNGLKVTNNSGKSAECIARFIHELYN